MKHSKTLIFLHGGPGYPDYLEEYFKDQFPPDVVCVFYTQASAPETGLAHLLEELDKFVQRSSSPYLVGHSWGGILAQKYLATYPDRKIEGLVLVSSFLDYEHLSEAYHDATASAGLEHPTLSKVFYTEEEYPEAKSIRNKVAHFDGTFFKKIHQDFLDGFHGEDFFRTLKLPILNIYGTEDLRTPAQLLRTFADLNPQVENVEIPGAGHFPFILKENRRLICRAIEEFLTEPQSREIQPQAQVHF